MLAWALCGRGRHKPTAEHFVLYNAPVLVL